MTYKVNVESQIVLDTFTPRWYQRPIIKALEKDNFKKLLVVMPRRAGKDIVCFNLMIRAALRRVGIYYYILPNATQARKVMFDGIMSDGRKILSFIPDQLIESVNIQQMKITLINNSIIQFVGSENYDSLRGTNPIGCVFSEYAYQHPEVYPTLRPILLANDGWSIFISTPFGENHFHTLYEIAKANPKEWFTYYQTVNDTKHMSEEDIRDEIERGEISPDKAQQEYYCSFNVGATGAYYAKYLARMELNNQVTSVEWEPSFPVYTAWDLGMRDATSIIFFQVIGNAVRIFDVYQNTDVGMEHYINVVLAKEYTYDKHFVPHDIKVREFTSGGITRYEKAYRLGVKFTIAPQISIIDGIECVRTTLPRTHIDANRCKLLITALRDYRKEYDASLKIYRNKPLHDHNSHLADAMRYLCISLPKISRGTTPEELEKRYRSAVYGDQSNLPPVFRTDLPQY